MKRVLSILMLLVFITANSNVALGIHWCGGKITHFGINSHSDSKCGCGMKMAAGCCKDVQVKVKLSNNDYKTSITKIIYPKIWKAIELAISELHGFCYDFPLISKSLSPYHSPPIINKAPTYLVNCVFIV